MNIHIGKSLALKLSLYIIACVMFTFLVVLVYNYHISRNTIMEDIKANTDLLADSTINQINTVLAAAQKIPENLAYILESTPLDEKQILDILRSIVANNDEIYGSTISFEPGMSVNRKILWGPYYSKPGNKLKYSDLGAKNYNYPVWEWYKLPKKLGRGVWSEPYFDEGGGNTLMVTYSIPFYKNSGGQKVLRGIITCDITLDWLERLISGIKIHKTGYAYILSAKGIFIAHHNKEYYTKGLSHFSIAEKYKDETERRIGERMVKGEKGFEHYFSHNMGKNCIVRFEPLETTGWSMGIVIPEDELMSELNVTVLKLFAIGMAGCLLTLILIIVMSARVTGPLRNLVTATEKISSGDFGAKIPATASADEIGTLSKSFNTMQENLVNYIGNLKQVSQELALTQEVTIECMASVAEFRDPETGMHIKRTQIYVRELALQLRNHPRYKNELDDRTIDMLYLSAPLHDIGKVGIPDNILLKASNLSNEEYEIMKKHTVYGRDAIAESEKKLISRSFLRIAKDMAYSHHEKWDGTGYPLGLKGDKIPLPGRLMAIADVYDALVTKRVYKPAFSHEKAVEIIRSGRGTHFDPDIVDAFLALEAKFREIGLTLADRSEPAIGQEVGKQS